MSYCQLGNLQKIEMGLRRSKQNTFIGTVKHPQEKPPGIPKVLSYSITLTGTRLKIYFPQNELHCLDRLCLYMHMCCFQWKLSISWLWKQEVEEI